MSDRGHELTDKMLEKLEANIRHEYAVAVRDTTLKLEKYLDKIEEGRKQQAELLKAGKITQKQYNDWVFRHTMIGDRWEAMKNTLAADMHNANAIAQNMIKERMPDVYALNMNYGTYDIEHGGEIDTGFTLYNHDTAEYLLGDERQLMPGPSARKAAKIAANKDMQWNKQHIQSAVLQGVLQGESPYDVAARLRRVGQMNASASIRYARTMTTSAQNAGRYNAFRRAKGLGVDLTIEWQATLDGRTRHDHRLLHGQRRDVDEPFEVDGIEILYPAHGGSDAANIPQRLIWNCRCTLLSWVKGFEGDTVKDSPKMGGMSFEEWQQAKAPKQKEQKPVTAHPAKNKNEPTIAGVERGEPMTHAQADTGRVNPHYSEGGGYRINCQSCVVTYEARLRGYDVEVVPRDKAHPMCEDLAYNSKLAWKNADGSEIKFLLGSDRWSWEAQWDEKPTAKRFEKMLQSTLQEDARYTIQFKWKGYNSGHIVNLEKDGQDLVIYDPQSNKTMRGKYVSDYLDRMAYKRQYKGNIYYQYPAVTRIDDKEIDFDVANKIMRKVGEQ